MVGPPTACPDCGRVMPSNCLPKHRRARHGDPRLALLPTLDEQARMIELYRRGMSQVAIGRELAWSASTVSRVLIMAGESRPSRIGHPPKLSADTVLETCQLYGLGYSTRHVADVLGLSLAQVRLRLARGGAVMRPPGPPRSTSSTSSGEPPTPLEAYRAKRTSAKSRRARARKKPPTARETA
jgi:predicted transcriptional regulator